MPDLAAELLLLIRRGQDAETEARSTHLRALERIGDGVERLEEKTTSANVKILAALGAQDVREAVVAEKLALVTSDGKRERLAVVLAFFKAFPPPLKKALTTTAVNVVSWSGVIILVGAFALFGVPKETLVAIVTAMVQPLAAAVHP